ncbi:MAG: 23S rRNA (uracil(1939)-C(5))-methyltransferase RlmD [Candidatus Woesearchaeota archaeon]
MICPYYDTCGGCSQQHLSYEQQLAHKKQRIQHLVHQDVAVYHDQPFGYRNRMDFICTPKGLGLRHQSEKNTIIVTQACPIANEGINTLLAWLQPHMKGLDVFQPKKRKGTFRYCVIRATSLQTSVTFILNKQSSTLEEATSYIKQLDIPAHTVCIGYVDGNTESTTAYDAYAIKGNVDIQEQLLGHTFSFSSQGFFQNNTAVAHLLHTYVREQLDEHIPVLADIYSGVGTFGILNANKAQQVHCVESYPDIIRYIEQNAQRAGVQHVHAYGQDAKTVYKLGIKPHTVIVDPPRSGMDNKTITWLEMCGAKKLIYISCNPQQTVKELSRLSGYVLKKVAMFDMFPQTHHTEVVFVLEKE